MSIPDGCKKIQERKLIKQIIHTQTVENDYRNESSALFNNYKKFKINNKINYNNSLFAYYMKAKI